MCDLTSGGGSLEEDSKQSCSCQIAINTVFLPMSLCASLIKSCAVLLDLVEMSGKLLSLLLVKQTIMVLVVLVENFVEPVFELSVGWHF